MKRTIFLLTVSCVCVFTGCNDTNNAPEKNVDSAEVSKSRVMPNIKEEPVVITADTTKMQCIIAFDDNKQGPRPIVLVVPEWWGVTDFPKSKGRELAALGYFAVTVDIYGNGTIANDPDKAMSYASKFYSNPQMAVNRLKAALEDAKRYPEADSSKTAAIGFCFGGSMVLNAAKSGMDLDGVVSFHGGLQGVPPNKGAVKAKILVCNGEADSFVSEKDISTFRKQLDEAGVAYTFKNYPNSKHAFTNPAADENARKFNMDIAYNEQEAKNAWNDMKTFFAGVW